jgi:hypothetical protein
MSYTSYKLVLVIGPRGKYPILPSNICIDPQAFVFAPEFNFNLRKYVKVQGKIK